MDGMIEVTAAKPIDLVKAAYALSAPQGLGFLHAKEGELSDADAQGILDRARPGGRIIASMDYVHGRACKFTLFREGEKHFIRENWFDHSPAHVDALLERVGITR